MRHTARVGLFFACIGLLAPRVFGDAVALEGKTFSAPSELFLIEVEHSQDGVDAGGFMLELCSHCKVNGDSPFLFNPNLSQAPFTRDVFAPLGGTSSMTSASGNLPIPVLTGSFNTSPTSTTTITVFDLPAMNPVTASASGSGSVNTGGTTTSTAAGQNVNVAINPNGGTGQTTVPRTVTTKADSFAANPEPASLLLLGSGLVAGVIGRRTLRGRRV